MQRAPSDKDKRRVTETFGTSPAYLINETDDPRHTLKRLSFLPPHRNSNLSELGTISAKIKGLKQKMLEKDVKDLAKFFLSL